jgi:hypothetical protein
LQENNKSRSGPLPNPDYGNTPIWKKSYPFLKGSHQQMVNRADNHKSVIASTDGKYLLVHVSEFLTSGKQTNG